MWIREFGTDWAVPDVIARDPEIFDQSWHNDAMPIFCLLKDENRDGEGVVQLSADHPDPKMSEFWDDKEPKLYRFAVWRTGKGDIDSDVLYLGDDAAEAVAVLKREGAR
jgi:hypothetical protein